MSGLFAMTSPTSGPGFGMNIVGKGDHFKQVEDIKKNISNLSQKHLKKLDYYKKLQLFNKNLTRRYVDNLQVMLDVTKILNLYMGTFEEIRKAIVDSDRAMDSNMMTPEDLAYLTEITSDNMSRLSSTLILEVDKLQKLLQNNSGFDKERQRLNELTSGIKTIPGDARIVKEHLEKKNSSSFGFTGGSKKKIATKVKAKKP